MSQTNPLLEEKVNKKKELYKEANKTNDNTNAYPYSKVKVQTTSNIIETLNSKNNIIQIGGNYNKIGEDKKSQLYKNILTAGISSCVSRTIIAPLERVEIFRQLEIPEYKTQSVSKTILKIFNNQGFTGLFKGNTAALSRIFPFASIEFYSMEMYKNIFLRGSNNKDHLTSKKYILLCGILTAFNAITLTYPLDVVRTRIASNVTDKCIRETRFLRSLIDLYKVHGIKGLYKGYYITFIGSIPFIAIKQSVYEILKISYKNDKYTSLLNFLYGSTAGMVGTTLLYPTYMTKRVLQANSKIIF